MKRLIYISIILASASVAAQQKADVLTRRLCHSSLETNVATWRYGNPALMKDRFASSLTTIDAFWRYDSQQEARLIEEGDGSNRAGIEAKAYVKKGSNDIWGEAGYDFGQRRNVMLNESSDYQTVYPYVTADLVGGDLHEENYRFSGGFAHTLKGGVTLGAFAGYNALLAYRTVDPRPRNLTSDLDFAAGMRWRWLGVALKAGKYKQTNVVKFYNETSQPTVYHATGLGTDYYRFRGANTNTYYNGRNFGIQADAASSLGKFTDFGIHVAYDYSGIDKIISSLNELPMASVTEQRINAAAHILTHVAATNTLAVEAVISRTQRDGNENIFGEAENNIYPEIASLTMFRRSITEGSLLLAYEHTLGAVRIQASATGGYASDRWRYTEPERLMESDAAIAGVDAAVAWRSKQWTLSAEAGASARICTSSKLAIPESDMVALNASVEQQYLLMANNDCTYHAAAQADFAMKPSLGIFCRLAWTGLRYAGSANASNYAATIGLVF